MLKRSGLPDALAELFADSDADAADRTLFSVDYPFEWTETASDWFDHAPIAEEEDRRKIGRDNAAKLLRIAS